MSIPKEVFKKVKKDGFYEEKKHDPFGSLKQAHLHHAYALTPYGTIVAYSAFLKTKDADPVNFGYTEVNAKNGQYNGVSGSYYTGQNNILPMNIEDNMSNARLLFAHNRPGARNRSIEDRRQSMPPEVANNFGKIEHIYAGMQEKYSDDILVKDATNYGSDIDFMIACKYALIEAKQKHEENAANKKKSYLFGLIKR